MFEDQEEKGERMKKRRRRRGSKRVCALCGENVSDPAHPKEFGSDVR